MVLLRGVLSRCRCFPPPYPTDSLQSDFVRKHSGGLWRARFEFLLACPQGPGVCLILSCRAPLLDSRAQLDREIAAGGWYIVKQLANSSVIFDWPHKVSMICFAA